MTEEAKPVLISSRVSNWLYKRLVMEAARFDTEEEDIIRVALWEYLKRWRRTMPAIPPDAIWDSIDPDAEVADME